MVPVIQRELEEDVDHLVKRGPANNRDCYCFIVLYVGNRLCSEPQFRRSAGEF
jgi:hypothetical protein